MRERDFITNEDKKNLVAEGLRAAISSRKKKKKNQFFFNARGGNINSEKKKHENDREAAKLFPRKIDDIMDIFRESGESKRYL